MKFTKTQKFSSIIHENYMLTSIIGRFGINLGFGDKNVEEVCSEHNINPEFFLEILKVFTDKNYVPQKKMLFDTIPDTIDYLLKSHIYYNKIKIPYIESLIDKLVWSENQNKKNSEILKNFFNNYRKEVREHTLNEEKVVYPYVLEIYKAFKNKSADKKLIEIVKTNPIKNYADKHEELNSSLLDLKNIIIKYLPPPQNSEITEQILYEIFRLEKDMDDHTRIEDTIVVPIIVNMENELIKSL